MNKSPDDSKRPSAAQALRQLQQSHAQIVEQVGKVIVGQEEVIQQILISILSGGHVLLVGVPGLAKTLMIRTLSEAMTLDFNRIQFTPDLMPSDITGTEVIQQDPETGHRELRFIRGPVFANMLLADEINRTPPKTQAALLEAMQEQQVTVGGERHTLDDPFMVLATQNPIEQEGTYPLPEALLDRFMMQIMIDYPTEIDELEIVRRTTSDRDVHPQPVWSAEQICKLVALVRDIPVADHIALYAIRLARLTRLASDDDDSSKQTGIEFVPSSLNSEFTQLNEFISTYIRWGAGPRASQFLVLAGKARAALDGRPCVSLDDIRAVAMPVMRHRIRTNFQATSDRVGNDQIVTRLIRFLDQIDSEPQRGIDPKLFGSAKS